MRGVGDAVQGDEKGVKRALEVFLMLTGFFGVGDAVAKEAGSLGEEGDDAVLPLAFPSGREGGITTREVFFEVTYSFEERRRVADVVPATEGTVGGEPLCQLGRGSGSFCAFYGNFFFFHGGCFRVGD